VNGQAGPAFDGGLAAVNNDGDRFLATLDGEHLVYVGNTRAGKRVVVLDGVAADTEWAGVAFWPCDVWGDENRDPPVDYRDRHMFSPDGQRLVYAAWAKTPDKLVLVVDGRPLPQQFDGFLEWRFSPNGKRFACAGRQGKQFVVMIDGKVTPVEGPVYDLKFSPDSKRVSYEVRRIDDDCCEGMIYLDGKVLGKGQQMEFSPDGKQTAYIADHGETNSVVLNGRSGPKYRRIDFHKFSPDGRHHAYLAHNLRASDPARDDSFLVFDGRESPAEFPPFGSYAFHHIGGKWVYLADPKFGESCVVIDGQPGPVSSGAGDGNPLLISPDQQHVAYFCRRRVSDDTCFFRLVLDGVPGAEVEGNPSERSFVSTVDFSQWACAAGLKVNSQGGFEEAALVRNGKTVQRTKGIISPIVLSPDGKRCAYFVYRGLRVDGTHQLYLDDQELPCPDWVDQLLFSPDGRHLACAMSKTSKRGAIVSLTVALDGRTSPPFDCIWCGPENGELAFDADGKLHYLAARGGAIYHVTQS
jgi:WD40 repeat protein